MLGVATIASCASLRQNLRGQELSYRGGFQCESAGCGEKDMKRSTVGTRKGDLTVTTVKLQPKAVAAFTAERDFDELTVEVSDCAGQSLSVPATAIKRPGEHKVGPSEIRESWAVFIDPSDLSGLQRESKGDCAIWTLEAVATWSDGARYTMKVGLEVGR